MVLLRQRGCRKEQRVARPAVIALVNGSLVYLRGGSLIVLALATSSYVVRHNPGSAYLAFIVHRHCGVLEVHVSQCSSAEKHDKHVQTPKKTALWHAKVEGVPDNDE